MSIETKTSIDYHNSYSQVYTEEVFPTPTNYLDYNSQIKHHLTRAIVRRFDVGDCRIYPELPNSKYATMLVMVLKWDKDLRVEQLKIDKKGLFVDLNNGETYQIDPMKLNIHTKGIFDSEYRIVLLSEDGFSSYIVKL